MKGNFRGSQNYNHHEDGDKLDLKSSVLKYQKHWRFFLACLLLTVLVAFLTNQYTKPIYKIQSKFLIKEEDYSIDLFDGNGRNKSSSMPKGQKIANESIILKSRSIAEDVLDRLPFDVEYYKEGFLSDAELYNKVPVSVEVDWNHTQLTSGRIRISWSNTNLFQLEFLEKEYQVFSPQDGTILPAVAPGLIQENHYFGEWVQFPSGRFLVNLNGLVKEGSVIIKIRTRESLIRQYTGDNLQVLPADKISSILLLTLDAHEPYKGRDYLDMLMRVFLENELHEKNVIASNTIAFIDSQLSGISDSLSRAENKLENYRSRNRTYNISSEGNTLYEKLLELEKSLSQEHFKQKYFATLQQSLANEQYSEIVIPSVLGIDDLLLNKLLQDLVTYQADKSRLLASQTENSPAVIEVIRKIKDLNNTIVDALKNLNRTSRLMIEDLSGRIARIETQFGRLPQTEQDLLKMQRTHSLNESIYTFLLQRRAEASIMLASNTPSNKIIEDAVLNLVPMRLRPLLNYLLAIVLGFLIPIAVIFVRDLFETSIRDVKEVEQNLSVRMIGCVGQNKKRASPVVFKHPRSRITEAFRALRANIDFLFPAEKRLTILITSSVAGEGKSFCSLNLGCVYSACERRTVIVRCDLHKPFSFDSLGAPNTIGLSNYLSGQVEQVDAIVQSTEYPYLDVIVPGPVPPNPAELLIGSRFKNILAELKNRYEVIVLDSSPVGLTNESLYITRLVDLTIYVLRQNYSDKRFIDNINRLKAMKKVKRLYALLNDVADQDAYYRGDGYGYYEDEHEISFYRKMANAIANKAAI